MTHFVSMKQLDVPYSFSTHFSAKDAITILGATADVNHDIENGICRLSRDRKTISLSLESNGGCRHYFLDYKELCSQLQGS